MAELRFPAGVLEDAVVRLRPWRETDVRSQLEAFSDPWFQRFSDWAPRTEIEVRRHRLEGERARRRGERLSFALVEPSDDESVLGGASLQNVESDQGRAAVGSWLTPEARGRGVATHAVRLLARWAFDDLGIVRVVLMCASDNHASQRVAERCEFSREGVLRAPTCRSRVGDATPLSSVCCPANGANPATAPCLEAVICAEAHETAATDEQQKRAAALQSGCGA